MKQGEIDYMKNIGEDNARGAYDKPFSHFTCSKNLVDMGIIMSLLPQPPARLLDLGCGTGWTSAFFARRGYRVVGQDIAPDMIDYARQNKARYEASRSRVRHVRLRIPRFRRSVSIVRFSMTRCITPSMNARRLQSVYRALRPGGVLVTHEPGFGHSVNPDSIQAMKLVRGDRKRHAAGSHSRLVHVHRILAVSNF